jgi:hypothetical protein
LDECPESIEALSLILGNSIILPTSGPTDISASMIDLLSYLQINRVPLQRSCEEFRFLKSMMGHPILNYSLCEGICRGLVELKNSGGKRSACCSSSEHSEFVLKYSTITSDNFFYYVSHIFLLWR